MIRYIESKSILSKLRGPDPYFGITYNINLYRGCQHACIYCDTRSECYGIHDISHISVKQNAIELLTKELSSPRKQKATIGTGSMNDPYMPLESETGLTRKALQVIANRNFPVHIITKSDLVTRDTDILQHISKTYAAVSFTITTADDSLSARIEPNAPVSSKRFKALSSLAEKGIYTGITLMPLLPHINDTADNIEQILMKAKDAGASYVIAMFGVTLRKGSRDYFYSELDKRFPSLKEKYESEYGDLYICNSPNYKILSKTFNESCAKLQIFSRIKFYEPPSLSQQLSLFD